MGRKRGHSGSVENTRSHVETGKQSSQKPRDFRVQRRAFDRFEHSTLVEFSTEPDILVFWKSRMSGSVENTRSHVETGKQSSQKPRDFRVQRRTFDRFEHSTLVEFSTEPECPLFRPRTLFVVVTAVACWLTYELNWVRQRRHEIITGSVVARQGPTHVRAPGVLSAFGEQGYTSITVLIPNCHRVTTADEQEMARIQRLFPEATIDYLSGTPGMFLDRRSPYHTTNRVPDG